MKYQQEMLGEKKLADTQCVEDWKANFGANILV